MEGVDRNKVLLLIGIASMVLIGVSLLEPIPQDLAYHAFADQRSRLGAPHVLDVLSNGAFLVPGIWGLYALRHARLRIGVEQTNSCRMFFAGVTLTAFGSGWYHLEPNNATLVWDRLPMTLAFMALLAMVVSEYVAAQVGRWMLWPLLTCGIASVVWWFYTELGGQGDLRWYAVVQFLPMLLLPLILLLFRSEWTHSRHYWVVFGWYVLAKVFEHFDRPLFVLTSQLISGHTLKHLAAAAGASWFLWFLMHREPQR